LHPAAPAHRDLFYRSSCNPAASVPQGHEIVGAIADERLANTPTAAKISALIDGISLEKAAVIADEIKGWDKRAWMIRRPSITPHQN
jgi:hypothetical protein